MSFRPGESHPMLHALRLVVALIVLAATGAAERSAAEVHFALSPPVVQVQPGEIFELEIQIADVGDSINGYDAVLAYDPQRLQLLVPSPWSSGEGALFTGACPQRFLVLSAPADSSRLTVSHVVLCAGVRVTGPGVTYRLSFRARMIQGVTRVDLVEGTAGYDAGSPVLPVRADGAEVRVGQATATAPAFGRPRLRVVPNPFNPITEIEFELTADEPRACLDLFDFQGRRVRRLYDGALPRGNHALPFRGRDDHGEALASGVYLLRLTLATRPARTTRVVLLR